MSSRKVDLRKRCFFVLSGLSNTLGMRLAVEMCRRFKSGSVAVLIEAGEEILQTVRKEIQALERDIEVVCCSIGEWKNMNAIMFGQLLDAAVSKYTSETGYFELAYIIHNEGSGATDKLIEPQEGEAWKSYVQENLNVVVALNQEFLTSHQLLGVEKLVVNIKSSLMVQPFLFNSLICSCKKARDMYFRAMADFEAYNGISVINYCPGILATHKPETDINNNIVDLLDLNVPEKMAKRPRVTPMQSTLKLINILEEMSFISGHDVDYYDTYNL